MIFSQKQLKFISDICQNHYVDFLYLFGSSLTDNFNEKSDYDFLVKFLDFEPTNYFDNYLFLKDELTELLKREVDLLEYQTLKNPHLINSIKKTIN